MEVEELILGCEADQLDIDVHLLDVQAFVCSVWALHRSLGWDHVFYVLLGAHLLLLMVDGDTEHPAIDDLDTLMETARSHAWPSTYQPKSAA